MWIHPPTADQKAHPARCRGCDAEIIWCLTKAGKSAPVNAGFAILRTQTFGKVELIEIPNDASHFTTCPKAAEFKRRK
jgi:hypothetical protein